MTPLPFNKLNMNILLTTTALAIPCFVLQSSSQCPQQNRLAIQATSAYSDTIEFDEFVSSRLDNNTAYMREFNSSFQCPSYTGLGQRFHLSIFCAMLTQVPKNCDSPIQDKAPRTSLCKDTCQQATKSLSDLFKSSNCNQSPNSNSSLQRGNTLDAYRDFCDTLNISNTTLGKCLDGSNQPQEQYNCGNYSC